MSGKGSSRRPQQVPDEVFNQNFDRIFGVTCTRCGKSRLLPEDVHTCSPQIKNKSEKESK